MTQSNRKIYTALVFAAGALALSVHTAVRWHGDVAATGATTCVDQAARDEITTLRRAIVERDAAVARLARAAAIPDDPAVRTAPLPPRAAPAEPEPRRYVHFETPNPAVSVLQNDDATYDVRTTDPALAGSIVQVTAVTATGEEDKLFIRVPQ